MRMRRRCVVLARGLGERQRTATAAAAAAAAAQRSNNDAAAVLTACNDHGTTTTTPNNDDYKACSHMRWASRLECIWLLFFSGANERAKWL